MKKLNGTINLLVLSAVTAAHAQRGTLAFPTPALPGPLPPPPAVWVDTNFQPPPWSAARVSVRTTGEVAVSEQKQHVALVAAEQAKEIIGRFKAAYPKLGSPRMLLLVSRELADGQGAGTVSDKQVVREVERQFGRPWRQADVILVNQKTAAAIMGDKPVADFIGAPETVEARQNHEALGKLADVVIEVLISSQPQALSPSGNLNIQATAVRLTDAKILGQAAASDLVKRRLPESLAGFSEPEIAEAVALALMEDLMTNP